MDKLTEERLKKKIMANEELTEEEKKYFVNYDEWKIAHDQARKDTIEGLRWNAWPILFICAFFLLSTAFNNTRYILASGGGASGSVYFTTAASWLLGLASVAGAFYMKRQANKIAKRAADANQLTVAEETRAEGPED